MTLVKVYMLLVTCGSTLTPSTSTSLMVWQGCGEMMKVCEPPAVTLTLPEGRMVPSLLRTVMT